MDTYLYILDYSYLNVYEIKLTKEDLEIEDIEKLFNKYSLNVDNCSWMFTYKKKDIINLND